MIDKQHNIDKNKLTRNCTIFHKLYQLVFLISPSCAKLFPVWSRKANIIFYLNFLPIHIFTFWDYPGTEVLSPLDKNDITSLHPFFTREMQKALLLLNFSARSQKCGIFEFNNVVGSPK